MPAPASTLDWALREWDWFYSRSLIGANGLVNDGLDDSCQNNRGQTWTYNQGVLLGGLAALYEITGDATYLRQGEAIADAALRSLTTPAADARHGILLEPGEHSTARGDGDRPQFKGIFVRNLYDFYLQSPRPVYSEFICDNARSIWANDRNSRNQFGLHWAGPLGLRGRQPAKLGDGRAERRRTALRARQPSLRTCWSCSTRRDGTWSPSRRCPPLPADLARTRSAEADAP